MAPPPTSSSRAESPARAPFPSDALPPTLAPDLAGPVPGPKSRALAERLARVESRNVTALAPLPIFWQRAQHANLWDVDGNRYVDLTAAFGVANVGHAHPEVVAAIAGQAQTLLHGMGDVHPARVKVELLEKLAALYPHGRANGISSGTSSRRAVDGARAASAREDLEVRGVLSSSGSDAVETAIKTAMLATGRAGILAFEGAYHGLSFGALDCTHRADFKAPFAARLPGRTRFARYGDLDDVRRVADLPGEAIGAVLVEPVQGRGGERVPPAGFLTGLRALCDERGWLLIADEIYTGLGRTGARFACDHEGVVPDLLCIGKGLASGMPLSACLGLASCFDAWPRSAGEALHTQTFLGHPASCAAALASLAVSERWQLTERSKRLGRVALEHLRRALAGVSSVADVRGLGLMLGIECARPEIAHAGAQALLERGYVLLPSGPEGRVLSLTPPLTIEEGALLAACDALVSWLVDRAGGTAASSGRSA